MPTATGAADPPNEFRQSRAKIVKAVVVIFVTRTLSKSCRFGWMMRHRSRNPTVRLGSVRSGSVRFRFGPVPVQFGSSSLFLIEKIDFGVKKKNSFFHKISMFRYRKIDFGCLKWSRVIPGTKIDVFIFSIKIHIKPRCSPNMIILTLFELLKPIKTDRKSIVVSGSLDITSGSRLK